MADEKDPNEATSHAETYHRHGDPDPSKWEEAQAVTDRPNDLEPGSTVHNSTLAERAKANKAKPAAKVVDEDAAENKAVQSSEAKAAPAKRAAKRTRK